MLYPYSISNSDSNSTCLVVFQTGLGWVGAAFSPGRLLRTSFMHASKGEALRSLISSLKLESEVNEISDRLPAAVSEQGNAIRSWFSDPTTDLTRIDLDTTTWSPFSKKVYDCVRGIPVGEVMTYAEVARASGSPRAARAVGRAMALNPVAPVVPCHRVVAASGKLHGFSAVGGLELKEKMLLRERKADEEL